MKLTKIFTLMLILYPITAIYNSPIPGLDIGTLGFILIAPIMFFKMLRRGDKLYVPSAFIVLLLYSFLITIVQPILPNSYYYTSFSTILTRMLRFEFVMFVVILMGFKNFFDFQYGIEKVRLVTIIASFYAIVQQLSFTTLGVVLPHRIDRILSSSADFIVPSGGYRAYSFFSEPSHFGYYMVIFLSYSLFSSNKQKKASRDALIITAGVIATTSGQALVAASLIWAVWLLKIIFNKYQNVEKLIKKIIFLPLVLAVAIYFFRNSGIVEYTIYRVYDFNEMAVQGGFTGRAGGYNWFQELPLQLQIFGVGYGNWPETVYFSSGARLLFGTGYISAILVLYILAKVLYRGASYQKIISSCFLVLMIGGGVYTATWMAFYLPFMLYRHKKSGAL